MILNINQVAELISRMNFDEGTVKEMLLKQYRLKGSQGIIDLVKSFTGGDVILEYAGQNKYLIKR